MSVFERLNGDNGISIIRTFEEIEFHLEGYIESVVGTEEDVKVLDDPLNRSISDILKSFLLDKIPEYKLIIKNNIELFENHDFAEILGNDVNSLKSIITRSSTNKLLNIFENIKSFIGKFENIKVSIFSLKNAYTLISQLEDQVKKATKSVQNLESAKLALEANETDKIFLDLSNKYEEEYELNNEYFRNSLILTVCCTILSVVYTFNTSVNEINWPVFISVKLLIVAVGVTLCTLFLRRSAHAKKLYEKAYQTHVEINAYPIFIKSLKEEDQQEITKELALRYFGKDIDQTQNDKIGDLIQDQFAASTEMIKASAELVKAKQGNGEG